jgi:hypothetical protein
MKPHQLRTAGKAAATRLAKFRQRDRMLVQASTYPPSVVMLADIAGVGGVVASVEKTPAAGADVHQWLHWLDGNMSREIDFRGVLRAFAALADAPDEAFAEFAEKIPPLYFCKEHGEPWGGLHRHDVCSLWRGTDGAGGTYYVAPIDRWRGLAQHVARIRELAHALHQQKPEAAPRSTWDSVAAALRPPWADVDYRFGSQPLGQLLVGAAVDGLAELAGLRLSFSWPAELPEVTLSGPTKLSYTLAAVARELMFEVAQISAARFCEGCGAIITGKYRRKWCRTCGKAAADREAQRRRRKKAP